MVTSDLLQEFILRCGLALEAEDRLILGSASIRKQSGGLLRLNNERYYQFVCWRALMSRWASRVEREQNDLELFDATDVCIAHFEMKRWMSRGGGGVELAKIKKDVEKLRRSTSAEAYLIVFSANPPSSSTAENMSWLSNEVFGSTSSAPAHYSFQTFDEQGGECEFWIAGWRVDKLV